MGNQKWITALLVSLWITGCSSYDAAEVTSSQEGALDNKAPRVTITSPTANSLFNQLSITLTGTCENGLMVQVSGSGVNANSTANCASGLFSANIMLSSGDGSKNVTASQVRSGLTGSASRSFMLDRSAPVLSISSPNAGAVLTNAALTIQGACESGLMVSISGSGLVSNMNASCSGTFSANVNLTSGDGSKSFSVSQTDAAGNVATVSRQVTLSLVSPPPPDTTPPVVTITSPAAGATLNQAAFTAQGACETGLMVVISGSGLTAGSTVSCNNSAYSSNLNLTSGNGSKSFSVAQTDAAGNNTTVNRQVNLNIVVTPPPSGQDLPGITMTLPVPNGTIRAVSSASQIINALNNAVAGDVITIAPGTYNFSAKLSATKLGTATQPIYLRAAQPGTVHLISTSPEGFYVTGRYYVFENLKFSGSCSDDSNCDNIFHIVGDSYGHIIRNNDLFDYNAPFKINADLVGDPGRKYPHDLIIEHNEIHHTRPRMTANPTNGVNIDGGIRFTVRANVIHDIANGQTGISYAGFMKANNKDGIFERNVVVCSKVHSGGSRIGLSFGGGGGVGNPDICDFYPRINGVMAEHTDGIVRNNIIMNCSDVGFYNNAGYNTRIFNNIFYNTAGIDSRFVPASLTASNNVIQGTIRNRDGGTSVDSNNLKTASTAGFNTWYANAGAGLFTLIGGASNPVIGTSTTSTLVTDDICGVPRTGARDMGPFNSSSNPDCATAIKGVIDGI